MIPLRLCSLHQPVRNAAVQHTVLLLESNQRRGLTLVGIIGVAFYRKAV